MLEAPELEPLLAAARRRYAEIERALADPAVVADVPAWTALLRERSRLEPLHDADGELSRLRADLGAAEDLAAHEPSEAAWLRQEAARIRADVQRAAERARALLVPTDPAEDNGVIIEVRAGAGGEEAALFAGTLLRMYSRYAERMGWRAEVLTANETGIGGYREAILEVDGPGVFGRLKFEGGVHRVQRVPDTEANGRVHTSTATVAVLPQADDVEVVIRPEDLEFDTHRSSGAGGQHVNRTDSAVRLTHRPTGIVVTCQDERSQMKNRAKAMKVLRARLYAMRRQEQEAAVRSDRRSQVGTGDRSERIRTYNFPQNRVTDDRIGLTLYQLRLVLDGDLDPIIDPLRADEQARALGAEG